MKKLFFILILLAQGQLMAATIPEDFVYVRDVAPTIIQELRYAGEQNFIGRPINGYESNDCILTKQAAEQLAKVQNELEKQGYSLKVFDGYRPQMAVNEFIVWSRDTKDQKMKKEYYPYVDKKDFFKLGYVAAKSGHTRGSTVDLTIVELSNHEELDMGTIFDFMDERSHITDQGIPETAVQNRLLLRNTMKKFGFKPYSKEWWHFTLRDEPYKTTYFNFPVNRKT